MNNPGGNDDRRISVRLEVLNAGQTGPVVPGTMDMYAGRPLAGKLGIKPGSLVALLEAPKGIVWPKQASGIRTDLTQQGVRDFGIGRGFVDYKICRVDATWSGPAWRAGRGAETGGRPALYFARR